MVKRFLITTALEETWVSNEPVLFLGEWCKRYGRKGLWSNMDAEVMPYHWDNRSKLHADYKYLKEFHERLLQDLTPQLNQIHDVDRSLRYWRILIGPWLGWFVQALFDRWMSIQSSISHYEICGTIVLSGSEDSLVPNDHGDFVNRLAFEDEWNHYIFSLIILNYTNINCVEHFRPIKSCVDEKQLSVGWQQYVKNFFLSFYQQASINFCKDEDAFLIATYLTRLDELKLYRRLGQVPQLWRQIPTNNSTVNRQHRQWVVKGENTSKFESFIRDMIPMQIPSVYLEGYSKLIEQTKSLPWPKKPRFIFTSNSLIGDDVFKAWAAEKVGNGSRLVAGQHGGHYGVGRWSFFEDHEIAVSDSFLTWGWTEPGISKIEAIGVFSEKLPLGVKHSKQPNALLVTCVLPQFSYWMYSVFVSSQYLDYFEDQCKFVSALPFFIQKKLTVRLFPSDSNWAQYSRWRDRFPNLCIDEGGSKMNNLIRKSRIYISTYNATTFLEAFNINVPTVIYWNTNHWELRDSAIPFFDELKRVNIFHETPESAARHVAAVWDNVDDWWDSPEVREVVERFKEQYCFQSGQVLDRLEASLC